MTPIFGPDELPSPATQITGFTEGLLARIAALEAELEHQTEARKRHAALEREAVLAAGKAIKRAEAAEAEVERLRWMLDDLMGWDDIGAQTDHSREEIHALLESRWTAREEGGDE